MSQSQMVKFSITHTVQTDKSKYGWVGRNRLQHISSFFFGSKTHKFFECGIVSKMLSKPTY